MAQLTLQQVLNLAIEHHRAGRLDAAANIHRQILSRIPNQPDALHLLGIISQHQGRGEEALRLLRRAIAIDPSSAIYHANLGNILNDHGQWLEAIAAFTRSLELNPNVAETHFAKGIALEAQERRPEAIDAYRNAARLAPRYRDAHNRLGMLLFHADECHEAILELTVANSISAGGDTFLFLGVAYQQLGKFEESAAALRQACELNPQDADAFCHLGNVLGQTYELAESMKASRRALELRPTYMAARMNLASALLRQGRAGESIAESRQAMLSSPGDAAGLSNYLLSLNYDATISREQVFAEHLQFGALFSNDVSVVSYQHPKIYDRKLRIGYVSPDFRDHPVADFIEPILENHDANQFEVFCFAHVSKSDETTQRLQRYKLHWRPIDRLSEADTARLIRDENIDVLVDLAGHTAHNRLTVLAQKPAPVQATYLGYANTTGLRAICYRLTDGFADPPGKNDAFYIEKLVRLPRSAWCYRPTTPSPDIQQLPGHARGYVTFASFNAVPKINAITIELWSTLLKQVPDSRLMLKAVGLLDASTCDRLAAEFARHGITANRLSLHPPVQDEAKHLQTYGSVDIALDPFPYNGTTTTCEALWMGVPVVTLAGESHASRVGFSLLTNVGLPALIAKTPEEYLEIATTLAGDLDRLAKLRTGLRERMKNSPLMDAVGVTRDLENAYRNMWKEWCEA